METKSQDTTKIETRYCANCGHPITADMETEDGVVCPECHWNFWFSETLPEGWKKEGYILLDPKYRDGGE